MFERLNEQALKALMVAEEEARRSGHNFIGTEHILLGLIGESTGIAARALASFGLSVKIARVAVDRIIGSGSGFVSKQVPYTPRSKQVLELAVDVADEWGLDHIATEHILLGLLREEEGVAVRVVEEFGIETEGLRARVMQLINGLDFPIAAAPPIPLPVLDEWPRAASREEALSNVCGLYSFIKADSVPPELLKWMENVESVLGVYLNANDDYLILCTDGIHWFDGEARTYIEYKCIASVELPTEDDDPYLKLVLLPKNNVLMLPVLHSTEEFPDFVDMYEFLWYTVASPVGKMHIQDIQSKEDLIFFLRQASVNTGGFTGLAAWLEQGAPNASWLQTLNIRPEMLQDASVWRLLALVLVRFPACSAKL